MAAGTGPGPSASGVPPAAVAGGVHPRVTVVGLGPAGPSLLSRDVVARMERAPRTLVRTLRHPAAEGLVGVESMDHHYEAADTFDEVYAAVVEELVTVASRYAPQDIVYAVPGSPLVAERTVALLRADDRVDVTVIQALSFLDLAWERLRIDPLTEGVRLVDAERFAEQVSGDHGPWLVAQCWSPSLLSEIKLSATVDDREDLPDVVFLHHLGLEDEQVTSVNWWDMDRSLVPDHLTSLFVPRSATPVVEADMDRLEELVRILRERCPWDRVQTHATLTPHLVEESYEVLDALGALEARGADPGEAYEHLQEELGDLLFQIVLHARLAQEEGRFSLADVARGVHDKLVHRHPHVFGDVEADTATQVVANWEEIKKREKGRSSVTQGIPSSLPALLLSTKLQRKALAVGLSVPEVRDGGEDWSPAFAAEGNADAQGDAATADAPLSLDTGDAEERLGELLFRLANVARRLGIDPEQALRARALSFRDEIVAAEEADASGASGRD